VQHEVLADQKLVGVHHVQQLPAAGREGAVDEKFTVSVRQQCNDMCSMRYWQTKNLLGFIPYSSWLQQGGIFMAGKSQVVQQEFSG
jgi:hypothetical protein